MAKLSIQAGATSQSVNIFVQNSSSTTGAGLTGFAPAAGSLLSGVTAYYSFSGANAASVSITLSVPATVGAAYSSGSIVEIDATHMPGVARLDLPNAMLATAKGQSVTLILQGGTNVAPVVLEIELTGWNNQDGVHGGMSALPNTACTTNGSLLTQGSSTAQINTDGAGNVPANAVKINGVSTSSVTTVSANQGTTQPVNFTGTSSSALVQADARDFLGNAVVLDANNVPEVDLQDAGGHAVTLDANNLLEVDTQDAGGHAVTLDGNNLLEVDVQDFAATAVTAGALPSHAAGASGGLLIAGTNAATTIDGLTLTGTAASGATPATAGLTVTGGAADTTSGGTAAAAIAVTGGAGAASTNGAAAGLTVNAGGTTTVSGADAVTLTATGNGDGIDALGAGTGSGLLATGGTTGNGITAIGGATSGDGLRTNAPGSGDGAHFTANDSTGSGVVISAAATGIGLSIAGGTTSGAGISVTTTSGDAVSLTPTNGNAITATGQGSGKVGIDVTGGTTGFTVNTTQLGGQNVTLDANNLLEVDTQDAGGHAVTLDANNLLEVDTQDIKGTASAGAAGSVGVDWAHVSNPTSTVNLSGTTIEAVTNTVTANATEIGGQNVALDANNLLKVDTADWGGTATAGAIPPDAVFLHSGTAQAGGASTITLDSGASSTNNLYQNQIVFIRSGTGAGQSAIITSYAGSTKIATIVGTWATNPDSTSVFSILPFGSITTTVSGGVNVTEWNGTPVATPNIAGVPVVDVGDFSGHAVALDSNNLPEVDTQDIKGTASAGTAGYVGPDWGHVNAPTSTVNLSGTTVEAVTNTVGANVTEIAGQTANAAGAVTFPGSIGTSTLTQAQVTGGAYALATNSSGDVTVGGYASGEAPPTTAAIATAVMSDTSDTVGADITTLLSNVNTLLSRLGQAINFDSAGNVKSDAQSFAGQAVVLDSKNLPEVSADGVTVETGENLRQAIAVTQAAIAGVISGSGGTFTVKNPQNTATRETFTVDGSGNRSNLTIDPPS